MSTLPICVDAGLVIRRVAFPDDPLIQKTWDQWAEQDTRLFAPSLLRYEITNVLYRYERQNWLSPQTVQAALLASLALPIELVEDTELHIMAHFLAGKYGLAAAYDAHYLALAERIGAELWTTDQRLFNTLEPFRVTYIKLAIHT
jgi:predicted nucleic acid-binding protein